MIKNIELSKSTLESNTPPGSDGIPIFYVLPNIHEELDLVTFVGLLCQAVVHLLKIFKHMLTAYLSPAWNVCLRTLKIHLILLPKFTT